MFGPYLAGCADGKTKQIIKLEDRTIEAMEMQQIPSTVAEFKNNKYYTVPSMVKKY